MDGVCVRERGESNKRHQEKENKYPTTTNGSFWLCRKIWFILFLDNFGNNEKMRGENSGFDRWMSVSVGWVGWTEFGSNWNVLIPLEMGLCFILRGEREREKKWAENREREFSQNAWKHCRFRHSVELSLPSFHVPSAVRKWSTVAKWSDCHSPQALESIGLGCLQVELYRCQPFPPIPNRSHRLVNVCQNALYCAVHDRSALWSGPGRDCCG